MFLRYVLAYLRVLQDFAIKEDFSPIDNNSVDYVGHLYDSTKIRTDDVPLLTDQFAPIETLLNPVTGTAYNIEQKQIVTNTKVDSYSIEGTIFMFVLPILITIIWIFYMQSIWRKGGVLSLSIL
jgi:hypothetical protein